MLHQVFHGGTVSDGAWPGHWGMGCGRARDLWTRAQRAGGQLLGPTHVDREEEVKGKKWWAQSGCACGARQTRAGTRVGRGEADGGTDMRVQQWQARGDGLGQHRSRGIRMHSPMIYLSPS